MNSLVSGRIFHQIELYAVLQMKFYVLLLIMKCTLLWFLWSWWIGTGHSQTMTMTLATHFAVHGYHHPNENGCHTLCISKCGKYHIDCKWRMKSLIIHAGERQCTLCTIQYFIIISHPEIKLFQNLMNVLWTHGWKPVNWHWILTKQMSWNFALKAKLILT
jgi:hypothetical protein